ncbi:hypothetical protein AB0B54_34555 [Microbispora bryophytorum]|uniref:hypothetical protein n=1 Tax=Microbispora bryophytorum TaxID=1460882 RepID=UPI0033ED009F
MLSNVFTVTDAGVCFTGSCDGTTFRNLFPRGGDAGFLLEGDAPGDGVALAFTSGAATVTRNPGTVAAFPATTSTRADPLFGHTGAGGFFAGWDASSPFTRGVGTATGRASTLRSCCGASTAALADATNPSGTPTPATNTPRTTTAPTHAREKRP